MWLPRMQMGTSKCLCYLLICDDFILLTLYDSKDINILVPINDGKMIISLKQPNNSLGFLPETKVYSWFGHRYFWVVLCFIWWRCALKISLVSSFFSLLTVIGFFTGYYVQVKWQFILAFWILVLSAWLGFARGSSFFITIWIEDKIVFWLHSFEESFGLYWIKDNWTYHECSSSRNAYFEEACYVAFE